MAADGGEGVEMKCPVCGEERSDVEKRRLPTAYVDVERNFLTSCRACFDEADEYWSEKMQEYVDMVTGS
jgi:hypothetical protein